MVFSKVPDDLPPFLRLSQPLDKAHGDGTITPVIVSTDTPYVPPAKRVEISDKGLGFARIVANYGFMETANIQEVIALKNAQGLEVNLFATSFFLGRESLLTTGSSKMARWRKGLFALLSRSAWNVSNFFGIPPNRVVELASQVEL